MKNYFSQRENTENSFQTAVLLIGSPLDPRNCKRVELLKKYFKLHVISWDRGNGVPFSADKDGYTLHIIKIDATNDPLSRLIPYNKFSNEAKKLLKTIAPILIDVQGLDMLRIAMSYKKKNRDVRVIYEVADLHRLLVDKQKSPLRIIAQKYLRYLDAKLCKTIDLLIITSEQYFSSYFSRLVKEDKVMVFPNVPDLNAFRNYKKKEHTLPLTIGFIGGIRYKKQIRNLLTAAQSCNMNVMLAGFENGNNEIEKLCSYMPNVEWFGKFDFDTQIAELYGKCDIIYSVYDADMENVRVALPNKLYESIYCELPIIVSKNTYLSELVEKLGVGISVDYNSPNELELVLQQFENDVTTFESYEENCRIHRSICNLEYYNNQLKEILQKWIK